jgi:hypothetical protein
MDGGVVLCDAPNVTARTRKMRCCVANGTNMVTTFKAQCLLQISSASIQKPLHFFFRTINLCICLYVCVYLCFPLDSRNKDPLGLGPPSDRAGLSKGTAISHSVEMSLAPQTIA